MQTADAGSSGALERFFKFRQWDTSIKRDTLAGLTTFMVMAYIIFVNPNILNLGGDPAGLPFAAVLTSTCLVAGIMTILMGLVTNRAYAIAPGMGLNAVVAFSLVLGHGLTMASAMGLIVLEGVAITILVVTGFREAIFRAIPVELKKAIVIGIGFFILFVGLVNGGLIQAGGGTPVALVDLGDTPMVPLAVTVFGIGITIIMLALRWRAAILLGIVFATVFAIIMNYAWGQDAGFLPGQAIIPTDIVATPDFSLIGAFDFGAFGKLGVTAAVLWIFSLMLSDFFDTMGTLVGVGGQAGYLDEKGDLPQVNRPLLVDSVAALAGGAVSASSATTYIESGAGVAQGGRTGWVAVVVGVLFLVAMFFSPIFGVVPGQATAAALVIVGYLMMATLTKAESEASHEEAEPKAGIDFGNLAFGLPAVLIITIMPLTYSITNGIGAGFIAYTLIRVVQGRAREVSWMLWAASIAFVIYFVFPWIQGQGWA
ncbi:MAG TPA: NCS2 family permease [Thermoleophilia bacterium]|nr:NCS2 family permease [Acidobacteriota bacterium]HOU27993.1 NCS2 family permease [Thermoleophilia bacterium]HQF51889.1 NCS2 family permease [Thermoleophilia bacterium]HQH20976.1 NCS2 family permease [Thermoleophilia bacterium]